MQSSSSKNNSTSPNISSNNSNNNDDGVKQRFGGPTGSGGLGRTDNNSRHGNRRAFRSIRSSQPRKDAKGCASSPSSQNQPDPRVSSSNSNNSSDRCFGNSAVKPFSGSNDQQEEQVIQQLRQENQGLKESLHQLRASETKSCQRIAHLQTELEKANSEIKKLQAELHILKQEITIPNEAPPPSRCFQRIEPTSFEDSIQRLLALTEIPRARHDLTAPQTNTAALVIANVQGHFNVITQRDSVKGLGLSENEVKAIIAYKLEHPYPVYRWLNGHLGAQRNDKVISAIGPFFVLLYRALEKLPKIKSRASRGVLVRDIPSLRETFDNYEEKCKAGKSMNFWTVASFSRDDSVSTQSQFSGDAAEDAIIYSCGELEGVDLEPFRPDGMSDEKEIMPLCPCIFRIESAIKNGNKLTISIRQCENHFDYCYVEPKPNKDEKKDSDGRAGENNNDDDDDTKFSGNVKSLGSRNRPGGRRFGGVGRR